MEEERKNSYLAESVKTKEKENKTQERLRKKHARQQAEKAEKGIMPDVSKNLKKSEIKEKDVPKQINPKLESSIEKNKKELEQTQKQLDDSKSVVEKKKENLQSIDDQLSRIEALYKKLQTKKTTNNVVA